MADSDFKKKNTDLSRQHGSYWDRNNSFDSLGLQTRCGISHGKERQAYDPTKENVNQGKGLYGYQHKTDHDAYWNSPRTESHKHLYPETKGAGFVPAQDKMNFDSRPKNIPQERKVYGGSSQIYACMTDVSSDKDNVAVERPMTNQGRKPEARERFYQEPKRALGVEETHINKARLGGASSSRAKHLFDRFDRDGNGKMDVDEFRAMAYSLGMYPDDERGSFSGIDTDSSGDISWEEFEKWWATVGGTFSDTEFDNAVRPFTSPVRSPTKKTFTSWNGVDGLREQQWEKDCFRPMVSNAPDVLDPNLPCTATELKPPSRAALNPWESHKLW